MDLFIIDGGRPLQGKIKISGSKNAALPILIATLLTDETCVIDNVPDLRDIRTTFKLLESLGKGVEVRGSRVAVSAGKRLKTRAPYDIVKQMRASVLVAGPLLARFGTVQVPIPGGCAIGLRPIDIHLKGFEDLGARRSSQQGDVIMTADRLRPGTVVLRFPSVGATENLMMLAAVLPGKTVIKGAAREPEIEDLGAFLAAMGASVAGAGTSTVTVTGTSSLKGVRHTVIPDRIETGTYLLACAAAGGRIMLEGARGADLSAVLAGLRRAGAWLKETPDGITIAMNGRPKPVNVKTAPHPGFPTDLQAPWITLMSLAKGRSRVVESVFENRFLHVAELARMGARITVSGNTAVIDGVERLSAAPIMASDIRAGAALVAAAVAAEGRTVLQRVYHVDRGYERIEAKLRALGVGIRRIKK